MSSATLLLYSRRVCPLCDDMLEELRSLLAGRGPTVEIVDVDADPQLAARYGSRVPVLVWQGRELCHGRLDRARIERLTASR